MSDNQEAPDQIEAEAKTMGWVPQDQFRGEADQWVSAEDFVERGRHVMPILLSNNKRLQRDLLERDRKIGTLESKVSNMDTAMQKLEHHYTEANKRAVENAKNQLKAELKQAREDDDVDAETDILGKLGDIQDREREAARQPVTEIKKDAPPVNELPIEVQQWYTDNAWFGAGGKENLAKTKAVTRIAEDLRDEGSDLIGVDFLNECLRRHEDSSEPETYGYKPPTSKVESGNHRGSGKGSAKGFASLPKEAKEACWGDVDDLVGEGKRYKTTAEWETAYAKIYHSED